jgi:hypothetical protein
MVALVKMPKFPLDDAAPEDRRLFPRKEVHADVQASRTDHTIEARRQPRLTLAMRDLSLGGLSAISPAPLSRGERLNVSFPSLGTHGSWHAAGRVIRCMPSALGYRIAVEFDPLPMAA